MTSFRNLSFVLLSVCFVSATAATSFGQTIAGEDFDGGATNGGFTSATAALYEGDFESGPFTDHDDNFNGTFDFGAGSACCGSGFFDRFGTVNATDAGDFPLPFDMVDDSGPLGTFATDQFGVLSAGVDNSAFGFADTLNGSNTSSTGPRLTLTLVKTGNCPSCPFEIDP